MRPRKQGSWVRETGQKYRKTLRSAAAASSTHVYEKVYEDVVRERKARVARFIREEFDTIVRRFYTTINKRTNNH